jgi:capsular exopolysaccharide synthesis family protein
MSKFFNETRKAQDWSSQRGKSESVDLSQVMAAIHEPLGLLRAPKEAPLSGCRKHRLPESSGTPALYAKNDFTNVAAEAYRTLRTRLLRLQAQRGLRSVVVSSAVPGEGKTLTTLNVALCCAQLSQVRILAIDGDLRTVGLTTLLGHVPSPGLGEILTGEATFEGSVVATDLPNLYVLGAGSSTAPASGLYSGELWREFIKWSAENFDLTLVDSPPILPLADFEQIAGACDGVLVVVRALHAQRETLKKAAKLVDAQKLVGVVLNASPLDSNDISYSYYGAYAGKG